ncbi:MAG: right-handed parallel beta-helix repeat-containing protein [Actinomycetota bacterium]|nr:right-handed parallel beta-helix repeat-containing protein [Actinomycetota bacterium]
MAGLLSTMLGGTASAGHVDCGDVITTDTTLDSDVGPCPGDGLIVRADNITLDLNGHRIFATDPNGPLENVGIRLGNVTGVTVQNGTVEGFDAGVFINMGGSNTIQRITALNNINDMAEPWRFVSGEAPAQQPDVVEGNVTVQQWNAEMLCFFGDGITTESSDNNLIQHNQVISNGPFGGITLVGDSDSNRVEKNLVDDNNINNWTTRADGSQGTGLCGATLPGAPGMQRGREVQAIGIRLEGPGADDNVIGGNQVTDSALVGISIHSWVCQPMPGEPRPGAPNEFNLITKNRVSSTGDERRVTATGFESVEMDAFADGIGSLAQGPIGTVTCTSHNNTIVSNNSSDNDRHGISLHRTVETTTVNENVANNNGGSGIYVAEQAVNNTLHRNRAHQNAEYDGFDGNPNCDNNDWRANRFLTVNQPCVAASGTGWVGGPGRSGDAPGHGPAGENPSRP